MEKLNEKELDLLCRLLLRLYQFSSDQSIRRVAKSLFGLLTKDRFSTDSNL